MKLFFFSFLFLIPFSLFAQKKTQSIWFLKDDGTEVAQENADFYRVIQKDPASQNFIVLEYYPDKTRKLAGRASKIEPLPVCEGPVVWYDRKGNKIKAMVLEKGIPIGDAEFYYPNGKLMKTANYGLVSGMLDHFGSTEVKFRVTHFYDSAGVELNMDGKTIVSDWNYERQLEEQGAFLNGLKTGAWKGRYLNTNDSFEEEYDAGQLVSGKATWSNGQAVKYAKVFEMPQFVGGEKGFSTYFQRNFKWPHYALERGLSGRAVLFFVVAQDGSLKDMKVIKSLDKQVDEEAMRVMRAAPPWVAGREHGMPKSVSFTLPLVLNVQKSR